jgi:HD-GYP domain-containing protein (c-di-GMP phosphodiesterase class II)
MRLVSLERIKPGDVLGQSILGVDGCLMLREGVILTEKYINKLIDMGIVYLYIKDSYLEDIKPEDPEFVEFKSEAVKSLSRVFSKLQYNDSICIKNTLSIITDMIEYLLDNKEIDATYLLELKTFDNYTYIHSLNTCVLALFFGVQMSYSRNMLIDLGVGALLHDLGKTRIPIDVLNKNGKLTDEEYNIIKKHPELGYKLVENVKEVNERARAIILEHHERVDGKGYPYVSQGTRYLNSLK